MKFEMGKRKAKVGESTDVQSLAMPAGLRIGTSAFTAAGWEGSFYPAGMKPADHLASRNCFVAATF